jgi:hypothetical protein
MPLLLRGFSERDFETNEDKGWKGVGWVSEDQRIGMDGRTQPPPPPHTPRLTHTQYMRNKGRSLPVPVLVRDAVAAGEYLLEEAHVPG